MAEEQLDMGVGKLEPVDPNADLIGFEFDAERGRLRVTGTVKRWGSTEYVYCDPVAGSREHLTVRQAKLLRRTRYLIEQEAKAKGP